MNGTPCVQRYVALLQPRSQDGQGSVQRAKRTLPQLADTTDASESPAQLPGFDGTVPAPGHVNTTAATPSPEWVDSNSTTFLDVRSVGVEMLVLHAVRGGHCFDAQFGRL